MTTAVASGGPGGSIPGIQALMDARTDFFESNADYLLSAPVISAYAPSNASPAYGETVTITATCSNETTVYLGYRLAHQLRFNRIQMYDDGAHNDGAAGDHVYGASVVLNDITMEYYIYADNATAGKFSPQRAEHEFYTLSVQIPTPDVGDVLVNEILASNNSYGSDSNGESDDWVELYNTTSSAKDLTGLYLTDDATNLTKWQIPTGTAINAHDVLVIWTDEDSEQSGLHTNFKLSAAGESVILSDGVTIFDVIDFGEQEQDISYARCPDGGAFTYTYPSFDALNNCQLGLEDVETTIQALLYPNPATSQVTIRVDDWSGVQFVVTDVQGRILSEGRLTDVTTTIEMADWNAGVYFVNLSDGNGAVTLPCIKQ